MKKTAKKKAAKPAVKKVAKKAVKKTAAKAVKAAPRALSTVSKAYNKSEISTTIADHTGVARKDVTAVIEALAAVIEAHIKKKAVGTFTLPGLLKVKTIHKPATKARKGINPFTGEETTFKAKPARTAVKILPLKKMKDMVK